MPKLTDITEAEESALALEFAEALHAGFPSPAADHSGERINLTKEMSPNPETTFYAHIEGDSMRDAGILDGDIVVVDRSLEPKSGDIIVAYLDGEYTVKEFRMDASGRFAWLIPHNPDFQPIRVESDSNFSVWGVVTYAVHKVKV
ncbi:MAG: translesion error-prone DNA polymerase V autoproteolytic subunit [Paludibacteraceae bacterium]|nr:translesion error-prone DNA polymerase V autoproteolytic subunit [Paludibacteraceae bacterium]